MKQIQVFQHKEFGSVRTLMIGSEPYFVGKDVAESLGYGNTRSAIARHVREEDKTSVAICDGGRSRSMTVINESGLYSLILSSKLEGAKKFRNWITSTVLPALRKHGVYALDEVLNDPEMLIAALQALKAEREAAARLRERVDAQQEQIREMEPKASYYDKVLSCRDALPVSVIAKDFGWSAVRMNRFLHECGIQYRCGKGWLLYAAYAGRGLTRSETILYTDQYGESHSSVITKWTQKGRLLIYELMKAAGHLPVEERETQGG